MKMQLSVNGTTRSVDAEAGTPLLWVLRDELGLTGTKYGCGVAQCGACTVHVDGATRRSCVTPIETVANADITTIEGLEGPAADAVRISWQEIDVPQCGYCQAGQIMSATILLQRNSNPSDEDIDAAMNGNLCRCATYIRIKRAIKAAAKAV